MELCRTLQPDLALLDVRMPDMDGLAAARAIRTEAPATRVIMVTIHDNLDYLLEAMRAARWATCSRRPAVKNSSLPCVEFWLENSC